MAERTTELRSEIEDTREHLGDTLDAIGDRVSPGRIVERRKNRARQSIDTMRERVMGARHEALHRGCPRLRVERGGLGRRRRPPRPRRGRQRDAGQPARRRGHRLRSRHPRGCAPADHEAEASVADSVVEPLKAEATDIGKEVGSTAKESATQAGQEAKAALSDAAATVKGEASSAAQDVKQSASDAADQVKSTARTPRTGRRADLIGPAGLSGRRCGRSGPAGTTGARVRTARPGSGSGRRAW